MTKINAYIKSLLSRKNSKYTFAQGAGSLAVAGVTLFTMVAGAEGETAKEDVKDNNVAVYDEANATTTAYNKAIEDLGFVTYDNIRAFQFLATLDAYELDGKVPAEFQDLVDANNFSYVEKKARPARLALMNTYMGDPDKQVSLLGLSTNATEDQLALLNEAEECINVVRKSYFALGETDSMINDQKAVAAYDRFLAIVREASMVLTSGQYSMFMKSYMEVMYGFITNDYPMYDHYFTAFEGLGSANNYLIFKGNDPREDMIMWVDEDLGLMYASIAAPCMQR